MSQDPAKELSKVYEPRDVEKRWWAAWENAKLFTPPLDPHGQKTFSVVIPPPNVTGYLHMGHALNNTLQDILVRFHRMQGEAVLWVFGMDHAGIATQNVVERQLKAEGKDRNDLGREAFIKRVWNWKEESGGIIRHQLKKLGCSLDYEHERFTMDEGLSRAVVEVFIRLYEEGKIYRAQRLINWCPRCHTALSDLEVEHQEVSSHLWHVRYPLAGDPQRAIIVATTRPETLLGDTAVAVHPDDERYQALIGLEVDLPFVHRRIPIIADAMVDSSFGSGAVKITPAHDFNDFETGNRHMLERVNVFTEEGRMNELTGSFQGQDRFEARKNIVKELEELDLLVKVEPYKTSVGHCYRCKTVVEPYLSMQWFVKMEELAKPALEAVKRGKTKIIPETWQNTYFHWMENIRDWCISRQIWWGHRIPAWYCGRCAESEHPSDGIIVSREPVKVCPHCGHNDVRQETDVLDTWFSSALWPFSTLGWPEKTPQLKAYYPTSVLVTGFDILFFWVARMMMMGLHFTKQVPFHDVYIHALVRDPQGQKMSKSKGNVIDPLEVMEKHGTDAFRFTLAALAAQGRDIKLGEERVLGYRNFCNKIWNAARLVLSKPVDLNSLRDIDFDSDKLNVKHDISKWMLFSLSESISKVREDLNQFRFNDAAMNVYHLFWGKYCDWFLEFIKETLKSDKTEDVGLRIEFASVAVLVLDQLLRLLHPFMPFLTEELWHKIDEDGRYGKFLAVSSFPQVLNSEKLKEYLEGYQRIEIITAIAEKVRQIRMETGVPLATKLKASFLIENPLVLEQLDNIPGAILHWVGLTSFNFSSDKNDPRITKGMFPGITRLPGITVYVDVKDIVDLQKLRQQKEKELAHFENGLNSTQKLLASADFQGKAPPELVEEKKVAEETYLKKIQEVKKILDAL